MATGGEDKSTTNLYTLMERRYEPSQGWLLFYEVANGTGYKITNYADALAMSIWSSKGIALHGFEFKRSRSDLLKELRDEKKAEAIQKFCDHWWLVVSDQKFCEGVEVPATWGVLAPRNGVLYQVRAAPKLEHEPWTPTFIAAMMRRFHEGTMQKDAKAINEAVEARAKELVSKRDKAISASELAAAKREGERWKGLYDALKERVEKFEADSGIPVNVWQANNIKDIVSALQNNENRVRIKSQLTEVKDAADRISKSMGGALKNLESMGHPKVK